MSGETATKSIIDPKYRNREKKADWVANFIDGIVQKSVTKDKVVKETVDGVETSRIETVTLARKTLDLDALFGLAKANSIDTATMEEQRDRPNAPGRIKMTLSNSLRAAARKRHGLYNLDGEWNDADAEFIGDSALTHNRDGSKIVVAKEEAPAAEETAEA